MAKQEKVQKCGMIISKAKLIIEQTVTFSKFEGVYECVFQLFYLYLVRGRVYCWSGWCPVLMMKVIFVVFRISGKNSVSKAKIVCNLWVKSTVF